MGSTTHKTKRIGTGGAKLTDTGFQPIHSSKLVGRMVNGVPKGTRSYIAAKTRELEEEKQGVKI